MTNPITKLPLPGPALDKAQQYMRGLRRSVLSYWYATLEDLEAATLEAASASFFVNILDEAIFETALGDPYRQIRARDRLGRVVTGLELIRNCETHSPILADGLLVERQRLGVPLHQGGQAMRSVYAWAEYDRLPEEYRSLERDASERQQRARGEAQDGYRKAVQGRHVIETLLDAAAFFEGLDTRLVQPPGPALPWAYGEAYGELPIGDPLAIQGWILARPLGLDRFELFLPDIVCRYTERRSARWPAADDTLKNRRRQASRQPPGGRCRQVVVGLFDGSELIGYSGITPDTGSTWVERRRQVWRDVRSGYRYYVQSDEIEVDLALSDHEQVVARPAGGTGDLLQSLPPAPSSGGLSRERLEMVETYDDLYLEMRLRPEL
jgi:hypothetical protein